MLVQCCIDRHYRAMSSSLRPWIDEFALPEKSSMAVTERNLDPKVQKVNNFLMTVRPLS